ncbi:putative cytochrome c-type heme lyase [Apostichopus japonicus]|uniref:Putative cytochrome c-type heme lyase n=1 Tax=Stichopus japonicus TaxID=307972 RepID=A0A2G8JDZ3_STIJA|nr:putative cytochrome c-type heme lyase [Apostichopus japonicus]
MGASGSSVQVPSSPQTVVKQTAIPSECPMHNKEQDRSEAKPVSSSPSSVSDCPVQNKENVAPTSVPPEWVSECPMSGAGEPLVVEKTDDVDPSNMMPPPNQRPAAISRSLCRQTDRCPPSQGRQRGKLGVPFRTDVLECHVKEGLAMAKKTSTKQICRTSSKYTTPTTNRLGWRS